MPTPIYELTEWAAAQSSPWVPFNLAIRALEAVSRGSVLDRDLAAPPGACADGACYLIADSATGAWAGHDGKMAVAVGVNAANGWIVLTIATEGQFLWVEDEAIRIQYASAAWAEISLGVSSSSALVATESSTSYDLASGDEGKYIRFTNASAKTVNVRNEADHALPSNGEWHLRNIGANDLTLVEDTAVTINPPTDGTLVVPPGGTVTLKRVAEDEFDLFGVTVPA